MNNRRTIFGMMAWLAAFVVLGLTVLSAPTLAAPAAQAPAETELTGPVQIRPAETLGQWTVAGIPVTVNSATVIEERVGPAMVGAWVKVEGTASAGTLTARRIKVMPAQPSIKLEGTLDALSATSATVDTLAVGVDTSILLVGPPAVGQRVEIKAAILADGSLLALRIRPEAADNGGEDNPGGPPELGNTETELRGILQSLPGSGTTGVWQVSGITVTVAATTEINSNAGPVVVGAWVKVEGAGDGGGGLAAREIKVVASATHHKLEGVLESLTDSIVTVDGINVARNSATVLDGNPTVGQRVEILAQLLADGTLLATKIDAAEQDDPSPNPDGSVEFVGTVESLPAAGLVGQWVVSGQTISVTATTEIDESRGPVEVGRRVKVEAVQESGGLTALEIKVLNGPGGDDGEGDDGNFLKFTGLVESLPASGFIGQWVVAGRTVSVTQTTRIDQEDGQIAVGVLVKVEGYQLADGSVRAREIEVKEQGNDLPDEGEVHLVGAVESRPTDTLLGTWTIAGRTVEVVSTTRVSENRGPAEVGVRVKVEGVEQADGSILASQLKTLGNGSGNGESGDDYAKFEGTVLSIPATADRVGSWQIVDNAGVTVTVNVLASTWLDESSGPIVVGSYVEVEGAVAPDGTVIAAKIEREDPNDDNSTELEFRGTVLSRPGPADGIGLWVIQSNMGVTRTVRADASTFFEDGMAQVGDMVEVDAQVQPDGSLLATKIDRENEGGGGGGGNEFEFTAPIVSFPAGLMGAWQIGDKTVMANNATEFDQEDGSFAVGVVVEVKGTLMADGTVMAERIRTKN